VPFADCDGYGHKVVNQTGELVLYPPITITKPIIGPVGPVDPETAGGGRLWAVALLRPSEPRDGRAARLPTHPRPRGGRRDPVHKPTGIWSAFCPVQF